MSRILAHFLSLLVLSLLALFWLILSDEPATTAKNQTPSPGVEASRAQAMEKLISRYFSSFSMPADVKTENQGHGRIDTTVTLQTTLPRPYLNLKFQTTGEGDSLRLTTVAIGKISLSGAPLAWLLRWIPLDNPFSNRPSHPQHFKWKQAVADQANLFSVFIASKPRLRAYYRLVSQWSHKPQDSSSMTSLLRPLFRLAYQRSTVKTAAAENQALLQVLATYINRKDAGRLFKLDTRYPLRHRRLTLQGRYDLAQHFSMSAAIASSTNERFANSIGVYKELSDIDKGSGFSFSDWVADMAGAKFGTMASRKDTKARLLQKAMTTVSSEGFFMPNVSDMPDHLGEKRFASEYGGVEGAAYQRLLQHISRRIDQCPLYRM